MGDQCQGDQLATESVKLRIKIISQVPRTFIGDAICSSGFQSQAGSGTST